MKLNDGNVGILADTSYNRQIKPCAQDQDFMGKREAEHKNPFTMTNSMRNEPWLAAYNVAKEKAVHNLETGNLQSVGGISGYCGEVTNVSHLTSKYQISKLMSKMRMDGRKESGNENKFHEKKTVKGFGIAEAAGRKAIPADNQLGLFDKAHVGPQRTFLNPTAAAFTPLSPLPFVNYPFKGTTAYPRDVQESRMMVSKSIQHHMSKIEQTWEKKNENSTVEYNQVKMLPLDQKTKKRTKSSYSLQDGRKKYNATMERSMEKGTSHCPCPPYCRECLQNIKAKM